MMNWLSPKTAFLLFVATTSFSALAQVPECSDPAVKQYAKSAIDLAYTHLGFNAATAAAVTGPLNGFIEDPRQNTVEIRSRFVRLWKLRSVNDVRTCRPKQDLLAGMLIVVARNPESPRDVAVSTYNIVGLPRGADYGATGWLLED